MFQENKKVPVILAIALILALLFNWKYFFKEKKTSKPVTVTNVQQPSPPRQATVAKPPSRKKAEKKLPQPEKVADYEKMTALSQEIKWGVDPFGLSLKKDVSKPEQVAPEEKEDVDEGFRLESILITEVQTLAVINNQLLAEGDSFEGRNILKITEDSVIMEDHGSKRELKMKEHKIPMVYVKTIVAAPDTKE